MSRERFEDLQAQVNSTIKRREERAAELQQIISNSGSIIAMQRALMDKAEQDNDPEAYAQAQTLYNMHTGRKGKAEREQGATILEPVLSLDFYNEVAGFIRQESEAATVQAKQAIKEHLDAAQAIIENADAYNHELHELAALCERVCKAGYTGEYRLITVSSLPRAWVDNLQHAWYSFK